MSPIINLTKVHIDQNVLLCDKYIYLYIVYICKIQKSAMTYRRSETYSQKISQKLTTTAYLKQFLGKGKSA